MTDDNGSSAAAAEQGRARRWGLKRARRGVVAGTIAPAAPEDARMLAVGNVARAELATPQVTVVSVGGAAAVGPGRGRRLRWFGWISGRVFHE